MTSPQTSAVLGLTAIASSQAAESQQPTVNTIHTILALAGMMTLCHLQTCMTGHDGQVVNIHNNDHVSKAYFKYHRVHQCICHLPSGLCSLLGESLE